MLEEFEDTKGVIRIRKSKKVVQIVGVRLLHFSTTLSSQWVFFSNKKISITKENGQVFVFIIGPFSIFFQDKNAICKFCITFCIFKIKSNNSLRFSQTCHRCHLDLAVTCSKRPD